MINKSTRNKDSFSFLNGTKIYLRPFAETDIDSLHKWFNDEGVTHYMFFGQLPLTKDQIKKYFIDLVDSHNNIVLVIEKKKGGIIGFTGLFDIHWIARKAEFRIMIGESKEWGKGYGTDACEIVTRYGFDRLNLNRIYLGVTDANKGAVRSYEKCGYAKEGVLREDIYRNSRYYDSLRMSILRNEFYEKNKSLEKTD